MILLILIAVIAVIVLGGSDSEPVGAGATTTEVSTAGTTVPAGGLEGTDTTGSGGSGTGGATTAGGSGTGGGTVGGDAPAAVRQDPLVVRLARGRSLPFTVGPWRRVQWRDAVFGRLRPQTQARARKVDYRGGFGIRLR